ncbi:MAG: hypothetical protein GY696_25175, partial [Gammaproteobacteria bacterium]|nr:hypothetical protein [Gammaproteobacteria bacterium]
MAKTSEIRNAFESRLSANYSTTDIAWDNSTFDQTNSSWIRAVLIPTRTENAVLGGLSKRYYG